MRTSSPNSRLFGSSKSNNNNSSRQQMTIRRRPHLRNGNHSHSLSKRRADPKRIIRKPALRKNRRRHLLMHLKSAIKISRSSVRRKTTIVCSLRRRHLTRAISKMPSTTPRLTASVAMTRLIGPCRKRKSPKRKMSLTWLSTMTT